MLCYDILSSIKFRVLGVLIQMVFTIFQRNSEVGFYQIRDSTK